MIHFIISLLINAIAVVLAAYIAPGVTVKNFGAALWVAFLIAILNPTIGWLLTILLNVATLGVFWVVGLGIITRTIAYGLVIQFVSGLVKGFEVKGCATAILFAIILAIIATILNHLFAPGWYYQHHGWSTAMITLVADR